MSLAYVFRPRSRGDDSARRRGTSLNCKKSQRKPGICKSSSKRASVLLSFISEYMRTLIGRGNELLRLYDETDDEDVHHLDQQFIQQLHGTRVLHVLYYFLHF